ncbi:WRKY transcription factor [Abeliophyllum distichum]|uniref:WRKY transcription factor n=1 Tax=Abeliophyllum distichum TaxID=126358 RepID=A0ABD1RA50_9LAMI
MPRFSPGPLTLVSSFFSEQGLFSFSQPLAEAMASLIAKSGIFSMDNIFRVEKEGNSGDDSGKNNDNITGDGKRVRSLVSPSAWPFKVWLVSGPDLQSLVREWPGRIRTRAGSRNETLARPVKSTDWPVNHGPRS